MRVFVAGMSLLRSILGPSTVLVPPPEMLLSAGPDAPDLPVMVPVTVIVVRQNIPSLSLALPNATLS